MKRLVALFLVVTSVAGCRTVRTEPPARAARFDAVLEDALALRGLTLSDLAIKDDYQDDACRLTVTRRLMNRPWLAAGVTGSTADGYVSASPSGALEAAAATLDVLLPEKGLRGKGSTRTGSAALDTLAWLADRAGSALADSRLKRTADEQRAIDRLFTLVDRATSVRETTVDSLVATGLRVDAARVAGAAVGILEACERLADSGDLLLPPPGVYQMGSGRLVVGSKGDDRYARGALLIVDPGGDDQYLLDESVDDAAGVCVIVDLAGDDRYVGRAGAGRDGIGIVYDVGGNDIYTSGEAAQGVGVAGVGALADLAGNDRYEGGIGAQGFGLFGIGMLYDGGGDDTYTADLLAQGCGGPRGVGVLVDAEGDDRYEAGGRFPDFREAGRFSQSMAQGFSLGIRPGTSGGLGVLVDGGGNDVYVVEYFGQGTAFWGGTGILADLGGDDVYRARRYAQGAAVHLSVGVLLDRGGADLYSLWGVGQGCGHDLGVGILRDSAGGDRYEAEWMAQGVGNSNGTGILDDLAGDDAYSDGRFDRRGFGTASRDYGSIGVFLDRGGVDRYVGVGSNGDIWTHGIYGVGLDIERPVP